jgi:hypothetical protein
MSNETNNNSSETFSEDNDITINNETETLEVTENIKGKIVGVPETSENGVIGSSSTNRLGGKKSGALGDTANGAIGSVKVDKKNLKSEKPSKLKKETVAVFSTKNVSWEGVGSITKGYNFFSKEKSDKWLTRNHVRLATPLDVSEEYGV